MKDLDNKPMTQGKIEVDENSNEPVFVDVPVEQVPINSEVVTEESSQITPLDGEDKKHINKQLKMKMNFLPKQEVDVSKRQRVFKLITYIVFVAFIVGVLAFTFYNDFFSGEKEMATWEDISTILSQNWYYIICAIVALVCCYLFKGLKLSIMCKSTTKKWHFGTCLETGMIGIYYNNVTPLAVGGQPFEIYNLSKKGIHKGVSSALPIATFFLNQFAFVILGMLALIFHKFNVLGLPEVASNGITDFVTITAIIGLVCCLAMPLLVVIFSMMPRVGASLVKLVVKIGAKFKVIKKPDETYFKFVKSVVYNTKCLKKIASRPLVFISTLLISFGEQLAMSSIAYFTLRFFGFDWAAWSIWEWALIMQMCMILYAAVSFIPTPGNSGAADFSFYFLFSICLPKGGLTFPAMIVWRFLSYYAFILIGFIYLTVRKRINKRNLTDLEQ